MRVGFIGDPVIRLRPNGTVFRFSPLELLDPPRPAAIYSPPATGLDLYAGVVEMDTTQAQDLLARAQAAGIRLALVIDVDGASGRQVLSAQENARITAWMQEKGLPTPGVLEGQIDYVERLQKVLNPVYSMDRVLGDLTSELSRRAAP